MTRPYAQLSPFAIARGEATAGGGSGTGVGIAFKGAMVKPAADQTAKDFTTLTAIAFDTENYDTDGFHDNSVNPSRLTVPAGVTKVRLTAAVLTQLGTANDWNTIIIYKNGAGFNGGAGQAVELGALTTKRSGYITPVLEVVEGDYFELMFQVEADASITINTSTFFAIEAIETAAPSTSFRGALVTDASVQSIGNGTFDAVAFDTEHYDTDDIHDTVTNNSRMTVPAGVTQVRLSAGAAFAANVNGSRAFRITKNGSQVSGLPRYDLSESANLQDHTALVSAVLEVIAGDYFEFEMWQNTGAGLDSLLSEGMPWFAMEIISTPVVARATQHTALVKKIADQIAADYSSGADMTFDEEVNDTAGFHDNSTNPERLTIPAGFNISKVRLTAQWGGQNVNVNGTAVLNINKNGAALDPGMEVRVEMANTSPAGQLMSYIVDVVAGDYFTFNFLCVDNSIDILEARTWFQIEVIE